MLSIISCQFKQTHHVPCFIHLRNRSCQATLRSLVERALDRIRAGARHNLSATRTGTTSMPHMKSCRFPHTMCDGIALLTLPSHARPSMCGSWSPKAWLSCPLSHLRPTLPSECSYKPCFLISCRSFLASPHSSIRTMYKESTLGSHLFQGRLLWKYSKASFRDAHLSLLQELSISIRDQRALLSCSTADSDVNIADSTRISPMIPTEATLGKNSAAVSTLVSVSPVS